jgi:phosphatidate cytidylyltransferase
MLRERLLTAALLIPVVVGVFLLGMPWLAVLILAISALAAYEVFAMLGREGRPVMALIGIPAAVAIAATGLLPGDPRPAAFIPAAVVVLAGLAAFRYQDPAQGAEAWIRTVFGAVYVGLLAFFLRILVVDPPLPPDVPLAWFGGGRAWLIALVAGVWTFDSTAYATGRLLGRHSFMPHISPKKTWEGVIGGVVGATAITALVLWGLGRSPLEALALGPLVAIAAQAGDLAESVLKRACGVKDSGRLFPGHGGMLDRIDSFLFAAPAVALYVAIVTI